MLFNSYTFILFFLIVCGLHYSPFPWRLKKFNLLLASYLFYAAWNPPFVILLWLSTIVDWYAAKGIARQRAGGGVLKSENRDQKSENGDPGSEVERRTKNEEQRTKDKERKTRRTAWRARSWLVMSLCVNLGLLGFFKYGNFLLDNFSWLVNQAGFTYQPAKADIILPVGISFYTFQTLSYTLDIYRGNMKPSRSFLDFALYVTFFPQLVAGPIVRAAHFIPQCLREKRANRYEFSWGLSLFILGLFQKIVVADGLLAPVAERLYAAPDQIPSFALAWVGTLAFAGQIFCDFAGYSTCAIGVAMCLGFAIPDNFRFPYAAIGFSDFWRRWHISLSSWLRDYLYIPLGGNRKGRVRTDLNLMATMLIGGLWHGASWTFVVWGGLHGAYLIVEKLAVRLFGHLGFWHLKLAKLLLGIGTFILICFTWVFFRATSFRHAFAIIASMFGRTGSDVLHAGLQNTGIVAVVMGAMLAVHGLLRNTTIEQVAARFPWWVQSLIISGMLLAIMTMSGDDRAFIYFQF